MARPFKIGLVLNPAAGVGGPAALKGSDGEETRRLAESRGSLSQVSHRTELCLARLTRLKPNLVVLTYPGPMGADVCQQLGFNHEVLGKIGNPTTSADTKSAVRDFLSHEVDLILFAGGDGTARDLVDVITPGQIVLGIPCGVKMHSGVFAINPRAAGSVVADLVRGKLVTVEDAEVRDVDEEALREGTVRARFYGELCVPQEIRYVQHTKSGGGENEALVQQEIAAHVVDTLSTGAYCIGSGSTTAAIMDSLGIPNTLLGVDVISDGRLVIADATESQLYDFVCKHSARIIVTVIGGQGHLFGRGNQQFSPRVIRAVGLGNINVVATKTKLEGLHGRPIIVDTGDTELDEALCGLVRIVTGYEDTVLKRVVS